MWTSILLGVVLLSCVGAKHCQPSVTTASGSFAPEKICAGQLIFSEEFDELNPEKWQHEKTLSGGGNWEFQYYNNNRTNSFTEDGVLYIRPSLTSDQVGEEFLTSGTLNVNGGEPGDSCTNPVNYGCERTGTPTHVLNPAKSARIRTVSSFSFKYGIVEVRAKMPAGDWLWPAVWLLPTYYAYGSWPSSGEIDLLESRGNRHLKMDNVSIGTEQVASTLHFGPYWNADAWSRAHWVRNDETGYDKDFHIYKLVWTPEYIKICIDHEELGKIEPDEGGFWKLGGFDSNPNILNPWRYGSKMAPFDQKFHILINLAVGGVSGYFPDNAENPTPKPWTNTSPAALTDFWNAREDWLPTWELDKNDGRNASLQVDYVRVWAL